jgi:hypothetical protein
VAVASARIWARKSAFKEIKWHRKGSRDCGATEPLRPSRVITARGSCPIRRGGVSASDSCPLVKTTTGPPPSATEN